MKNWPSGLTTLLNADPPLLIWGDLYTFTLVDGTVLRFTSYDADITVGGHTWTRVGPNITRSQLTFTRGTEVDTMDLTITDDGSTTINSIGLLKAIAAGALDGSTCELDLAAMTPGGAWQGPGVQFLGINPEITAAGRTIVRLQYKSKIVELNTMLPRMLVQGACRWTLFDSGCTLTRASFATSAAVASGSNKDVLNTALTQAGPIPGPTAAPSLNHTSGHSLPAQIYYVLQTYTNALGETVPGPEGFVSLAVNQRLTVASPASATGATGWNCYVSLAPGDEHLQNATPIAIGTGFTMPDYQQFPSTGQAPPQINQSGYFDLGMVVFTSGQNIGQIRGVKSYTNPSGSAGIVTLTLGLPFVPTTGDTFTIYPGCNKAYVTCDKKFSNKANFGGMPFIPSPETAI